MTHFGPQAKIRIVAISAACALLWAGETRGAVDTSLLKSQEGTSALMRGRFDAAVAAYDEALKDTNLPAARQASLYSDRGVAKWRLKQLDGALQDLTKSISLNPDYAPAYNNRGNVLMELGRTQDAFKDFDKAVALSPGFGAAYCNRANANEKLKRFDAADDDFRKAIAFMPASAVPFNGRGMVEDQLGRDYTALRYLNRAIGLNAQYGPAYANRATLLIELGRFDEATDDLDKAIALAPGDASLYVSRGRAYAKSKRDLQAFRDFSKALELDAKNADALIGRASQNAGRRRFDLALEDLNQAIALDPKKAEAYYWRGRTHDGLGDSGAADQDLTKAIELNPQYSEAYGARAELRDREGKRDEANADYRKALELAPLSEEARGAYRQATGDTADSVVKPVAPAVSGWEVYSPAAGRFLAVNDRYPKLPVSLEMAGGGTAQILEWTPLKDQLAGIGLLRYGGGEKNGKAFEYVAIVDFYRNQVVTIEPYIWGDVKSKWDWTQSAVTVTDPDGVASTYELRKPRNTEQPRVASDNPWNIFGLNSREHRHRPQYPGGGFFGWLFQ